MVEVGAQTMLISLHPLHLAHQLHPLPGKSPMFRGPIFSQDALVHHLRHSMLRKILRLDVAEEPAGMFQGRVNAGQKDIEIYLAF